MLTVDRLTKAWGGRPVLDQVSLHVGEGQVVGLVGPNGAGKSTLIGCLSGGVTPDAGTIRINGTSTSDLTPRTAHEHGVAVIHQHLSLIGSLDVVDNVFLGGELRRWGKVDRRQQRAVTVGLLTKLGVTMPLDRPVSTLSTGQQQLVEIVKALRRSPRFLILDEPTAALGVAEADALLGVVEALAADGMAVLYISHLLEEVRRVADKVAVLRDGVIVLDQDIARTSVDEMAEAISPGSTTNRPIARAVTSPDGPNVLTLADWTGPGFRNVDLDVSEGEVVGVFGLLGSGRTELMESLVGARRSTSGRVTLYGQAYRPGNPPAAARLGVHLVPSDRAADGIFDRMRADDNVLAPTLAAGRRLARDRPQEARHFSEVAAQVDLQPRAAHTAAGRLSGGNQQKLLLARFTHPGARTRILLVDEPTQGVDIGARLDIYRHLQRLAAERGIAVVFTSSDPEEVTSLAARAFVLHRGTVVDVLSGPDLTHERLLRSAHLSPHSNGGSS